MLPCGFIFKTHKRKIYFYISYCLRLKNHSIISGSYDCMGLETFYFFYALNTVFFVCLIVLQGMPGGHGKKGEMGRPVKFSLNILHNFHILNKTMWRWRCCVHIYWLEAKVQGELCIIYWKHYWFPAKWLLHSYCVCILKIWQYWPYFKACNSSSINPVWWMCCDELINCENQCLSLIMELCISESGLVCHHADVIMWMSVVGLAIERC